MVAADSRDLGLVGVAHEHLFSGDQLPLVAIKII